jgi:uncharacterized membrane protein
MRREAVFTGVLLGIGVVGFLDEAVLHQLLSWHAFYWATDERGRLLSDGLFHVAHTALLLWGVGRLWRGPRTVRPVLGGALVGGGGFNLYDGVVNHLVMHFHLVNERVCPTVHADNTIATCRADIPYEIAFDAIALLVIVAGVLVLRRSHDAAR